VKKKLKFLLFIGISRQIATEKCLYPSEIQNVFIKLRNLTEEVKTYYGFHALLLIIESVLLVASSVTKLAFNFTNDIHTLYVINKMILIYYIFKMIFIFFMVREAHNTIKEVRFIIYLLFSYSLYAIIKSFYII